MRYLLLLFLPLAASAQTYDVGFTAGGGAETVTGTLTLSGGAVQNYALRGSGADAFSYTGFAVECGQSCGLTESGLNLYFNPTPDASIAFGQYVGLGGPGGRNSTGELQADGYSFYLSGETELGADPPLAAPEITPHGAAAAITLLAAALAIASGRRRSRGARSR